MKENIMTIVVMIIRINILMIKKEIMKIGGIIFMKMMEIGKIRLVV